MLLFAALHHLFWRHEETDYREAFPPFRSDFEATNLFSALLTFLKPGNLVSTQEDGLMPFSEN